MTEPRAPKPDAIVVLGCRLAPEAHAPAVATRRAETAARAYHERGARIVVASGGRRWGELAEADFLAAILVQRGVPRGVVTRELCSLSTLENAKYTAELLRSIGLDSAYVATCDWHMARALACFAWAGVRAVPVPAATGEAGFGVRVRRRITEGARRLVDRGAAKHWTLP